MDIREVRLHDEEGETMKRDRIIRELNALAKTPLPECDETECEVCRGMEFVRLLQAGEEKLLELIDDPHVTRAFNKVRRWGQ